MLSVKKMVKTVGLSVATVVFSTGVFASNAQQSVIGVVNMQTVMQQIPQVSAMQKKIAAKFLADQKKLQKMQSAVQQEQAKLQKNQSIMSKSGFQKALAKFQESAKKLQAAQKNYQRRVMAAQSNAMNALRKEIQESAAVVAKNNSLLLLVPGDNVLYTKPGSDYTHALIQRLKRS